MEIADRHLKGRAKLQKATQRRQIGNKNGATLMDVAK